MSRNALHGVVVDHVGPVSGALVRIPGDERYVVTNARGEFLLPVPGDRQAARLTAWREGYVIQGIAADKRPLEIELRPLPETDHAGYEWIDPAPDDRDSERCGNCHPGIYDEWQTGGHARGLRNRQFMDLYGGQDGRGGEHAGWSLVADHPHGIGVCAPCHAPGIDFDRGASDDLREVSGVAALGVHCDFCHKIQDVSGEISGLAHGRYGFHLLRPASGQLFFGPLDDVDRGEDACAPLYQESRYCAACHEGVVFGVRVYSTYTEWLESPARRAGSTCQSCHMAPTGSMTNVAPGAGGLERDPARLASHRLLPEGREAMLKRSLAVEVHAEQRDEEVVCRVTVIACDVGHRVPTGFIDRHLLLVVEPFGESGDPQPVRAGPRLGPEAGASLGNLPGNLFGRLLTDSEGRSPAPFWRPIQLATDTRLEPEQAAISEFRFAPATTRIRVRLLYRRFWNEVSVSKGWPDDTITVYDRPHSPRAESAPSTDPRWQ